MYIYKLISVQLPGACLWYLVGPYTLGRTWIENSFLSWLEIRVKIDNLTKTVQATWHRMSILNTWLLIHVSSVSNQCRFYATKFYVFTLNIVRHTCKLENVCVRQWFIKNLPAGVIMRPVVVFCCWNAISLLIIDGSRKSTIDLRLEATSFFSTQALPDFTTYSQSDRLLSFTITDPRLHIH